MTNFIELYRDIIPFKRIINDNHDTNYRVHQANLEFLTTRFKKIENDELLAPGGFKMPSKETITIKDNILVRCEIWKPRNIRFDAQNYAKTFKAPLDMLVSRGYLSDDSWTVVAGIMYSGGGPNAWGSRPFRYENDGLPDDLLAWWKENEWDLNDPLIRIMIGEG